MKRTICLDGEASRLLDVQAFGMGLSISDLVGRLVLASCRDYELKFRGGNPRHDPERGP